ncbi:MAG: hypothetical protein MR629_03730 [Helicobacter sp.]|nr:hypothetical protein [Helicobacter sp.]MCI7484495.1 hypothetical protein [Helicobacter sp.]
MLRFLKRVLNKILHITMPFLKRKLQPTNWHHLRSLEPVSRIFGFDRGMPIDRIYQEDFLQQNAQYIKGEVCEIAENTYTKKFGIHVTTSHILHYNNENSNATIIGDLTKWQELPANMLDCFICTVTLNFIYDYKSAIKGIYHMLKPQIWGGAIHNLIAKQNPGE